MTVIDISNKPWLDEEEAITYTTLSRESLRKLRENYTLPYRTFGKKKIYAKKHLDELLEKLPYHINGSIRNENAIKIN